MELYIESVVIAAKPFDMVVGVSERGMVSCIVRVFPSVILYVLLRGNNGEVS